MTRKLNFYSGPATMPLSALEKMRENLVDYQEMGLSLMETSHRSKEYEAVHNEAISLLKELLSIPTNYQVIFVGGGATLQFAMVPMNFLRGGKACDLVLSDPGRKRPMRTRRRSAR